MRDILQSFLDASAVSGEWRAAVEAMNAARRTVTADVGDTHFALLARILSESGQWCRALAWCWEMHTTAEAGAAPAFPKLCYEAARGAAVAGAWPAARQILNLCPTTDGKVAADASEEEEELVRQRLRAMRPLCRPGEVAMLAPGSAVIKSRSGVGDSVAGSRGPTCGTAAVTRLPYSPSGKAYETNLTLTSILRHPKDRTSWIRAIGVFQRNPSLVNVVSANILLQLLARQGRRCECVALLEEEMPRLGIEPNGVTAKTAAETAWSMRSPELCHTLLRSKKLTASLGVSAAVPVVLALDATGEVESCFEWWRRLSPTSELRQNLKLSSYVAVCLSRGGRWRDALEAFDYSYGHDWALATLFALRAMRVAGAWEQATALFQQHRAVLLSNSSLYADAVKVLTEKTATSWIPREAFDSVSALAKSVVPRTWRARDVAPPSPPRCSFSDPPRGETE